jgi:hypothetical protein
MNVIDTIRERLSTFHAELLAMKEEIMESEIRLGTFDLESVKNLFASPESFEKFINFIHNLSNENNPISVQCDGVQYCVMLPREMAEEIAIKAIAEHLEKNPDRIVAVLKAL